MRLEGKVALISGGSRGMGAYEAELFIQEGAKVVVGDVREDEGRALAEKISEGGGDAVFVRLDVTSETDWAAAVQEAVTRYGKLDVLVNNAGVSARGSIEETSVEDWDRVMDINAKGVFLGTRTAIPEMRKAGGGSIVRDSHPDRRPQRPDEDTNDHHAAHDRDAALGFFLHPLQQHRLQVIFPACSEALAFGAAGVADSEKIYHGICNFLPGRRHEGVLFGIVRRE